MHLTYKVSQQYGRGPASKIAEFKEIDHAKKFIHLMLESDAAMGSSPTYILADAYDELEKFDASNLQTSAGQGSQSQSSSSTSRPSPFATTPKPAGTAKNWWKEEDEGEKK